MIYGTPTARRRDAQRNRAAILKAASAVLARDEPGALMPEIARRAGIGQATLYRHFPDRTALTVAVIAYQLEILEARVNTHSTHPAGFRDLLREVLHSQIEMRGLIRLARRFDVGTQQRYMRRLIAAFATPMRQAREHGHVRADLTPADLTLLFTMVQSVVEATGDATAARTAADRAVSLMLDGVFLPD
ncbi:AcrR family transcriptional regulator [Actinoplanes campanulatus]|uniref:AcrR family transcriptional regulator n=1 Tax=Actinoplanes campanulatus TaxID=113559 RepID=A0A7W5FCV4_9ACTN|nr:TetR/AcrR family transcriptional regulator [Actinoplanes campanulatus]MBB3093774.1 AcrR family transcriptional regulator [Actinoplanes campanulatus]GGN05574.1 transcriptional regulator [Actinoplanes campanulatus]GID35148.1 transcriptional regulator [Actinoplanes campanulatus]